MNENLILFKVAWHTNLVTTFIPDKSEADRLMFMQEERAYINKMFQTQIFFLQTKGLTTRIILKVDDAINDECQLVMNDLTEDGVRFYITGINEWIKKLDKSKNRNVIVSDTIFLDKKYKEYLDFERPFFNQLISKINSDKNVLVSRKKIIPFIEQLKAQLTGEIKCYFDKRSSKKTTDLMYALISNSLEKPE